MKYLTFDLKCKIETFIKERYTSRYIAETLGIDLNVILNYRTNRIKRICRTLNTDDVYIGEYDYIFRLLYLKDFTDEQIALAYNLDSSIVSRWRKHFALPDNCNAKLRIKLYISGYTDKNIARRLHATIASIVQWRDIMGFKANDKNVAFHPHTESQQIDPYRKESKSNMPKYIKLVKTTESINKVKVDKIDKIEYDLESLFKSINYPEKRKIKEPKIINIRESSPTTTLQLFKLIYYPLRRRVRKPKKIKRLNPYLITHLFKLIDSPERRELPQIELPQVDEKSKMSKKERYETTYYKRKTSKKERYETAYNKTFEAPIKDKESLFCDTTFLETILGKKLKTDECE